jgi:hypothetical protein
MATNRSAAKTSKRPNKDETEQARRSKKLQRVPREPNRARRRDDGGARLLKLDSIPTLADRVQAEREQLFKALAIIECCKYATATSLEVSDSEYIVPVFDALCDLLNATAGELGRIAEDCEGASCVRRRVRVSPC